VVVATFNEDGLTNRPLLCHHEHVNGSGGTWHGNPRVPITPRFPIRRVHKMINNELPTPTEQFEEGYGAFVAMKFVVFCYLHHG